MPFLAFVEPFIHRSSSMWQQTALLHTLQTRSDSILSTLPVTSCSITPLGLTGLTSGWRRKWSRVPVDYVILIGGSLFDSPR